MNDAATARRTMVDNQVRTADVTDLGVLDAMDAVPREVFVPASLRPLAYIDDHAALKPGRYLMRPASLAKLLQLAAIGEGDRVLVVGCGTGYSAAVAARIAASVVAVEEDPELAAAARTALDAAGAGKVDLVTGPAAAGAAGKGPYAVILFDGAIEVLPEAILGQLTDGGRLVAVQGAGLAGRAWLHIRSGGEVSGRPVFNCALKPLPGFQKAPAFVF